MAEMPHFARLADLTRSRQCEKHVQQDLAGTNQAEIICLGERLQKTLPPFMKWPIWRARPNRIHKEPGSLTQLRAGLLLQRQQVLKETFALTSLPRIALSVTYANGELSTADRRNLIALTHHAHVGARDEYGWTVKPRRLAELVGARYGECFRRDVAASLWRMAGAGLQLSRGDPLATAWGVASFYLLPLVTTERRGREQVIIYDLPDPAKELLRQGQLVTEDMQRLLALRSPTAETLYVLLYDLAQWQQKSYRQTATYQLEDLATRLGLSLVLTAAKGRTYTHWAKLHRQIERACERVARYAGFLRDWEFIGRGTDACVTFFFTDRNTRRHLPPKAAES
ncbi:MAG: hypothetical protein WA970_10780 [Gammaproteobacteria bacterium]